MRLGLIVLALSVLLGGAARAAGLDDARTGLAAFEAGHAEEAIAAFDRALGADDLAPEDRVITLNNRGVAWDQLGDYRRAIADYEAALAIEPEDPTTLRNLRLALFRSGDANILLGRPDRALADYDRAIELDGEDPRGYVRRGRLQIGRGDLAAAEADLAHARALAPDDPEIHALAEAIGQARIDEAPAEPEAGTSAAASPSVTSNEAAAEPSEEEQGSADPVEAETAAAGDPMPELRPAGADSTQRYRALGRVNIRSSAGNGARTIGVLNRGEVVVVEGQERGWLKIRLQSGERGFVYGRWLSPVRG
jgi:tetratricopeptide (TPR) repeat protein